MTPQRTALISGTSSGIGRASATLLASEGWRVLATVRRIGDAPTTPVGATGSVEPLVLDVTDPSSVDRAQQSVHRLLDGQPLAALINNAGIGVLAPMETVDPDELLAVWQVNVLGVVRLTQAVLPLMASDSRLVIVGSIGDRLTMPFGGALTSSKWAVASIAEAFRLELANRGIKVTLIEPGSIHSSAVDKVEEAAAATAAQLRQTDSALAERFACAAQVAVENERNGSDPAVVASVISRALDAAHPRTRVLVGKHARVLATAAAVLPDRVLDRLRLRLFRQSSAR